MGQLFSNLCKGPVLVVDDAIGKGDLIDTLIEEIKNKDLPVFECRSINEVRTKLSGFIFCNFIILDWRMDEEEKPPEVEMGEAREEISERIVIDFIKELQQICFAPIFVLSNLAKTGIESKLRKEKIIKDGINTVFVENKTEMCTIKDTLIGKIESWIKESPHIYLAKWWINEWLSNSTKIFWDLYNSNSDWPAWFYDSFKKDGDEPLIALVDSLFQLIYSEMSVSSLEESYIEKKVEQIDEESLKSLKKLYERLVYTRNDIDKDIRPGDIFRIEEGEEKTYLLNLRPECDTTKRIKESRIELYCLRGKAKESKELEGRYDEEFGVVNERKTEILLFLLDGNDVVKFDNRKLEIWKYTKIKDKKICRVVSPFINEKRQHYGNFLGRIGVPRYPDYIYQSIFDIKKEINKEKSKKRK